jgi:hypothetical protein
VAGTGIVAAAATVRDVVPLLARIGPVGVNVAVIVSTPAVVSVKEHDAVPEVPPVVTGAVHRVRL